MKFNDYEVVFSGGDWTEEEMIANCRNNPSLTPSAVFEVEWNRSKNPYYDVYPSILPMMLDCDLGKIPAGMIKMPAGLHAILVRLPQGSGSLEWVGFSILDPCESCPTKRLCVVAVIGAHRLTFVNDLREDDSILKSFERLTLKTDEMEEGAANYSMEQAIKIATMICLMGNGGDLIQPQVLNRDLHKEITPDLIDKAIRRGKHGFSVGKGVKMIPHFRRPHLALQRYGEGRKKVKVIMRGLEKPIFVHREKIESVPTGYLENSAEFVQD